jgi:hypothetical protein
MATKGTKGQEAQTAHRIPTADSGSQSTEYRSRFAEALTKTRDRYEQKLAEPGVVAVRVSFNQIFTEGLQTPNPEPIDFRVFLFSVFCFLCFLCSFVPFVASCSIQPT